MDMFPIVDPPYDPPILSREWREWHVRLGDKMMKQAELALGGDLATSEYHRLMASALATVAQAHYAAANVRPRELPSVTAERTQGAS